MSYNKFVRSNVSKLGSDIVRSGGLTPIMEAGVMSAIPIWELLNITEQQYKLDYQYKAFVKSEEAITMLMKEAYDQSLNIVDISGVEIETSVMTMRGEDPVLGRSD